MVIRVLAVPDYLTLAEFDEIFCAVLGWDGLGFSFHVHAQEFTSFLRRTKVQREMLRDFQLRPRETFLYTCGGWIFGNGSSGFSLRKRGAREMRGRCAWRAGAHLPRSTAAAPRVTD